jgi:hypothetical protein
VLSKALLCSTSEYFAKALENGFSETEKHVLTLPESNLDTVRLSIYWLSKHTLPNFKKEVDSFPFRSQEMQNSATEKQESLVRLWCFADRFLIPTLQNAAMKQILNLLRRYYVRAEIVDLAFRLSSHDSALRPAVLRSFLHHWHSGSPINAYGGLKYEQADIDRLGETLGIMPIFLELINKSAYGKFPCTCGSECYRAQTDQDVEFMVAD